MTLREVLVEARRILENVGWCQGTYARDENSVAILTDDPGACQFCVMGALYFASDDSDVEEEARALLNTVVEGSIVAYNDAPGRTKEEVLAVFDLAIARCGGAT